MNNDIHFQLEQLAARDMPVLMRDLSDDIMSAIEQEPTYKEIYHVKLIKGLIISNVSLLIMFFVVLLMPKNQNFQNDSERINTNELRTVSFEVSQNNLTKLLANKGYIDIFVNMANTKKISIANFVPVSNVRNINSENVTIEAVVDAVTAKKIDLARQNHSIEVQTLDTYQAVDKKVNSHLVSLKDPDGRMILDNVPNNAVLILPEANTGREKLHILKDGYWVSHEA